MTIGEKLCAMRNARDMSQMELAEELCVSRQTISRWEKGISVPTMENLSRIAQLFQIPFAELVGDEPAGQTSAPAGRSAGRDAEAAPGENAAGQGTAHATRRIGMLSVLVVCALAMVAATCIGFYIVNQKLDRLLPEDNITPVEEIEGEEVDISGIEPAILQPLQP